jgi:hypothetical protein
MRLGVQGVHGGRVLGGRQAGGEVADIEFEDRLSEEAFPAGSLAPDLKVHGREDLEMLNVVQVVRGLDQLGQQSLFHRLLPASVLGHGD